MIFSYHYHDTSSDTEYTLDGHQNPIPKAQTPKYVDDSYSTEKKVCLLVVITEFKNSGWNREDAENDAKLATHVLERRKFDVLELVGKVTKKDFNRKLAEIQKRTDIGLFMLVVSSHGDENDNVMFSDNESWEDEDSRLVLLVSLES